MTPRIRNLILAVVIACGLTGCGGGQKEVVIEGPSEAERAAQMENMTPEQKQMVEILKAGAIQPQPSGEQQPAQDTQK